MTNIFVLLMLAALSLPAFVTAQTTGSDTATVHCSYGPSVPISRLGRTRIHFTDGTIKKDCYIKEFKDQWVIYEKDGSLHDTEIEKISYIELGDKMRMIQFDEKLKPRLKYINY